MGRARFMQHVLVHLPRQVNLPDRVLATNKNELKEFVLVLADFLQSEDVTKLASYQQARKCDSDFLGSFLERVLEDTKNWRYLVSEEQLTTLMITATAHSMNLAAKEAPPPVLLGSTETSRLVAYLLTDTLNLIEYLIAHKNPGGKPENSVTELLRHLSASGIKELLPALANYCQKVVIKALKKLALTADCLLQQQQQQKHTASDVREHLIMQFEGALCLVHGLQRLWLLLFKLPLLSVDQLLTQPAYAAALPAAIHLAAAAVPLLGKVSDVLRGCSSSSATSSKSTNNTKSAANTFILSKMISYIHEVAAAAVFVSKEVVAAIAGLNRELDFAMKLASQLSPHLSQALQQQVMPVLSSDKLPELLLMSLAHQAAGLQSQTVTQTSVSAVTTATTGTAAATESTDRQQARSGTSLQHQGLLNSHKSLIRALGAPDVVTSCEKVNLFDCQDCQNAASILSAALYVRLRAARTSSSSSSSVGDSTLPGTHLGGTLNGAAALLPPDHLVLPAIKTLIEIVLMLPAGNIGTRVACLDAVMLLFEVSTAAMSTAAAGAPVVTATAAAAAAAATRAAAAADDQPAHASQPNDPATTCPWPVIPAALAAGLLRPVVQLLSRVVIQALEETVEPKHIAAALKSDPVIPLVAIEAVLRYEAEASRSARRHLLDNDPPHQHNSDQTKPIEHKSFESSTTAAESHSSCSSACTTCPKHVDQSALQLLPFLTKIVSALQLLTESQQFCAQFRANSVGGQQGSEVALSGFLIRVHSLVTTALKIGRLAAEQDETQQAELVSSLPKDTDPAAAPKARLGEQFDAQPAVGDWYTTGTKSIAAFGHMLNSILCQPVDVPEGICNTDSSSNTGEPERLVLGGSWCLANKDDVGSLRYLPHVMLVKNLVAVANHQMMEQSRMWPVFQALNADSTVGFSHAEGIGATECSTVLTVAQRLMNTAVPGCIRVVLDLTRLRISDRSADVSQLAHAEPQRFAALTQEQCNESLQHVPGRDAILPYQQQMQQLQQLGTSIFEYCIDFHSMCVTVVGAGSDRSSDDALQLLRSAQSVYEDLNTFHRKLQSLSASLLAELPDPFCCNNPNCVNLSKLSEYQLVSGKACVCGGCKVARYCSRECQKKHWKLHKQICAQ